MGSYAAKLFKGTRSVGSGVAYFILFFSSVLIVTEASLADEVDKAYSAIKNKNFLPAINTIVGKKPKNRYYQWN